MTDAPSTSTSSSSWNCPIDIDGRAGSGGPGQRERILFIRRGPTGPLSPYLYMGGSGDLYIVGAPIYIWAIANPSVYG